MRTVFVEERVALEGEHKHLRQHALVLAARSMPRRIELQNTKSHVIFISNSSSAADRPLQPRTAMATTQNKLSRTEWKQRAELDAARKAGTVPAEVDEETGLDINPHIPQYMSQTPCTTC